MAMADGGDRVRLENIAFASVAVIAMVWELAHWPPAARPFMQRPMDNSDMAGEVDAELIQ